MSAPATVQQLAAEASRWFFLGTRDSGERFVTLKAGHPGWLHDLTMDAHGDMLPDDWRYRFIREAVDFIAEAGEDADLDELGSEFADDATSVYTSELCEWLGSHLSRVDYCDEFASEFGANPDRDTFSLLSGGQYMERGEVFASVLSSLAARVD